MKFFLLIIIVFILTSFNSLNAKGFKIDEIKNLNSKVFFMRHALAPGFGDPENFKLDDCSTQRNLSNDGINQAREISKVLKKYDVKFTKVYSSYWCRCNETVKSMGLKSYQLHSGLNSFYQNYAKKKGSHKRFERSNFFFRQKTRALSISHALCCYWFLYKNISR